MVLAVFALILILPARLYAAETKGEVLVSDDGTELHTKFKITLNDSGNSGNGFFQYSDEQSTVRIKVKYLKVDGEYAWFAGKCVEDGIDKLDRWFFAVVHDGGKPGNIADHIWWEWLDNTESIAKSKVENLEIPSERKQIKDGDITVKS